MIPLLRVPCAIPKNNSDIALLYFKGGLPSGFRPAHLFMSPQLLKTGTPVWIAGYGPISDSSTLTQVNTVIENQSYAATEFALLATPEKRTTKGDSGGPAFVIINKQAYVFGVCNWGDAEPDHHDIYASITSHLNWIQSEAARLRSTQVSQGPDWPNNSSTSTSSGSTSAW